MARLAIRFVLLCVILCFVASVCQARRGRYRYSARYGGGSSGVGGLSAGTIVGIICGVIGSMILVVGFFYLCKACSNESLEETAKNNSSGGVVLTSSATNVASGPQGDTTTRSSPNVNSYKPYQNQDVTKRGQPPSYVMVSKQKGGAVPYTSNRNGDPAYSADVELYYPPNPSGLPYPLNPAKGNTEPPAPSCSEAEGGPGATGGPGPIGFENSSSM